MRVKGRCSFLCTDTKELLSWFEDNLLGFVLQKNNKQEKAYQFSIWDMVGLLSIASVLMAVGIIPDEVFSAYGSLVKAYGVLLVIYSVRGVSILKGVEISKRPFLYCLAIVALLPFVFFFLNLYDSQFRFPLHKWVGDPIWVFAIPTISFIAFDLTEKQDINRFLIYSPAELIFCFPIWTIVWIFLQFAITDCFVG